MFLRKRVLFLVSIIVLFAVLTGCGPFNDDVSRDRIIEYVTNNHETLEAIAEDEAYTDLEALKINGLDAIGYSEVDKELNVTFQYVSFITDDGYVLTFTYWDMADEDYQAMVVLMVASIQPEEAEAEAAA